MLKLPVFDRVSNSALCSQASTHIVAQIDWRGHTSSIEGVASTVDYKGTVEDVLSGITQGVRSGLSYSGTRTIREFQAKAKMIQITSSGMTESKTHIFNS